MEDWQLEAHQHYLSKILMIFRYVAQHETGFYKTQEKLACYRRLDNAMQEHM